MFYIVNYSSIYDPQTESHANIFWSMRHSIRVSAPVKYIKGDLVKITGVTEDEIRVLPVVEPNKEDYRDALIITLLLTSISLSIESEYKFRSNSGVEILTSKAIQKGQNKRYMLLAGVPQHRRSLVYGYDQVTKTRIEFNINVDMEDHLAEARCA